MKYRVFVENERKSCNKIVNEKPKGISEVEVYSSSVSAYPFNRVWNGHQRSRTQSEEAYFVSFDMNEPTVVTVEVSDISPSIAKAPFVELRPYEFSIPYDVEKYEDRLIITIHLDEPRLFSLEINGTHKSLAIFANEPYACESRKDNDIYFGKGVHHAGLIVPKSNSRVILDEGAVVYGVIYAKNCENVTIEGRGILDSSIYHRGNDVCGDGEASSVMRALEKYGVSENDREYSGLLNLYACKNVKIEGIILRDSYLWTLILRNGCNNVFIDNIKIIGQWRYNSDGVDICNSSACVLQNSFIRSFDDCVVVRAPYLDGESGGCSDIVVRNNVLWCDWGKNLEIWSGHKDSAIKAVVFLDNYLIHVSMTAVSIDTWYGSESIRVSDIVYLGVYVYPDAEEYEPQIQGGDEESFDFSKRRPYEEKNLICLCVGKVGKRLPNQGIDPNCDCGSFKIEYENIAFNRFVEHGERKAKRVFSTEHLKLSNIKLDGKSIDT